jgi:hypothetical protein
MTRMALAVLCVLALSSAAGNPSPAQEARPRGATDRGVLAVVRRDGLLIPFAAYKGDRWQTPWPITARNRELPVNIAAIPDDWWGGTPPETWRLHLPEGVIRPLSTTAPRVYRSFCDTRVGLVTDYRSAEPLPMPPTDPYPKDGLAISTDLDLLPIESVDKSSSEAAKMARVMLPEFNKAEQKTLRLIRNHDGWRHPLKDEARATRPVTIEAWYRAPMDEPGWVASYIEAVRPYPVGASGDGCGLETVFTGWVHENVDNPRKTRLELTARVTYCDRRGVKYMLPFGRIHVGDQLYWVYQFSGFDQEWYEVARMTPLKMGFVVESYGGGRSGCGLRPGPI